MVTSLNDLMKQAQKIQSEVKSVQEEISEMEICGEAGGGAVSLRMNGSHNVVGVSIDPALLVEDKDILEDLLAAAVNDAVRKVDQLRSKKMSDASANLNLPAGVNLPF